MAKSPLAGVRNLFERLFPERQFYHRSHGEVRFVSMSAQTQVALLIVTMAFLSWVAYSSVNVVFKEQIISAKQRNLVTMQQSYEVKLAEMQAAYDRLHAFLVQAEDRFKQETTILLTKQEHLETLVSRKGSIDRDIASLKTRLSIERAEAANEKGTNRLLMQVTDMEPAPRVSRDTIPDRRAGRIELIGTLAALTVSQDDDPAPLSDASRGRFAHLNAKIAGMQAAQRDMVMKFEERLEQEIATLESVLGVTELPIEPLVQTAGMASESMGTGGPLFSVEDLSTKLESDPSGEQFSQQMVRLSTKLDRLSQLNTTLSNLPLARPVNGLRISSRFGPRIDPFTKRVAMHSGTDFPGAYRTPIYATAPGIVVRAGRHRAYGRLVEVDHGHGFRTRYAHLNKIRVKKGQKVKFRAHIGDMGSSGRSTGPHLHYEVWYKGRVKNAERFLEAGRYVYEN